MDDSPLTNPDLVSPQQAKADTQASRKRKVAQKTVVTVKIEAGYTGKQKGEGPPSDLWSWRKYGQKPIKGSPYPRGYYRCSTSKGCSAKKQVERCRTDPSLLIITYTSDHNHPDPDQSSTNPSPSSSSTTMTTTTTGTLQSPPRNEQEHPTTDSTKEPTKTAFEEDTAAEEGEVLQLQAPAGCPDEQVPQDPTTTETGKTDLQSGNTTPPDEGGALACPNVESTEDNFYDELEELPVSSSFTGWVRSSSFDDRVLLPLPIPLLDY